MKDYHDLALRYGGFTKLDLPYLSGRLRQLTPQQALDFITPPPSVLNATFAELYQTKSPKEATDYYLSLSLALDMLEESPSFVEKRPFVRLQLAGKAYGFSFVNRKGLAVVFSQQEETWSPERLFELAQVFPHYQIWAEKGQVWMKELDLPVENLREEDVAVHLTRLAKNDQLIKIWGPNIEEVMEVAAAYQGQAYYAWFNQMAILYLLR